ncbi:unnamed protein product [Trifolium pratense]|uniref:Uncharacterized protein n=1 Tax=Trifolium pratense TaxID=57577 RepID=A0ACB0I9B6_TRIPR|nr:unnamed protein product [Trifolium pratense]
MILISFYFDFAKVELLGSGANEDSPVEISNSESQSPGVSGTSTVGGISESSKVLPNRHNLKKLDYDYESFSSEESSDEELTPKRCRTKD